MTVIGDVIEGHQEIGGSFAAFQRVDDRRWVSGPTGSIRQLFEFEHLKGNIFSARWGWSVDFVPLLSGRKLGWKRTAAKARFDLCIDPIDTAGSVPGWCSFAEGASPSRIADAASAALGAASKDWSKVPDLEGLVATFEQRSGMIFQRFSLDNYAQTDLAWGLALIALGRTADGERHLAAFCENFDIDPVTAIFGKAKAEAEALARPGD